MSKTRFIQWIVLACIGTVAACTSSEDGTVGNTELNVIVPTNAGTPDEIDIQTVEYTINCEGNGDVFLDNNESFPDQVTLNGNLEVVDGRTNTSFDGPVTPSGNANPGFGTARPGDLAEVWQGFMDLPPGPCSLELRARDNDGEVICTAREGFSIAADVTSKVNLVLICDVSFQAPVGMLDVDATFSFNVGNFCPDLFQLNCLDSAPALPVDGAGNPTGDPASTTCEVRFRDGDSTCGAGCDPQSCVADPTDLLGGLACTPGPDPGEPTTLITCVGGNADCDANGNADVGGCTWDGDQLGTLPTNVPFIGNAATFDILCDGTAGATVTCTAVTTDGDEDCNKTKTVNVTCPGDTPCTSYGGNAQCTADAGTVCRADICNTGTCDGATNAACCDRVDVADGLNCSAENNNLPAECQGGVCTPTNCTANTDCDDENQCTEMLSCDVGNGFCCVDGDTSGCSQNDTAQPLADGRDCTDGNADPTKGGYCLSGDCEAVECRSGQGATDCDDSEFCTIDTCDDTVDGGSCVYTNQPDNTDCSAQGGAGAVCFEVNPPENSQCVVGECAVDGDCNDNNTCTTDACNTNAPGGLCEFDPAPNVGERCATPNADAGTCQSDPQMCGVCLADGNCQEKPVTCDLNFRDVVPCQTVSILSVDCTIFGSGVPIVLDPVLDPSGPAFSGIPLDVQPQAVITLPASLTCGFNGVVPFGTVFGSEVDFDVGGTAVTTYSYIDPDDPFGNVNPVSPHDPDNGVTFDFFLACGNKCNTGFCGASAVGQCDDGTTCTVDGDCAAAANTCVADPSISCTPATQRADCVSGEDSGPGVVVPFFPHDPSTDPDNSADPSATGQISVTPGAPGSLIFTTYTYDGVLLPVVTDFLNVCIGGKCDFFVTCPAADRTGPAFADGGPAGDPGICRPAGLQQVPTDCCGIDVDIADCNGRSDAPRVMYDADCDKIGAAACGGTPCAIDAQCPFNATLNQACGTVTANLCDPVNLGFCVGSTIGGCSSPVGRDCSVNEDCDLGATCTNNAPTPGLCFGQGPACVIDDDCPPPAQGFPVCCAPYFEYNAIANVCAAGQPGTTQADTDAPTVCGNCVPLGCVGDPANPDIGLCRNGPNDGLACDGANGISNNPACPQGSDPDVEVICRVPCTSCDQQSCCDVLQARYKAATPAQFPITPVNPAP